MPHVMMSRSQAETSSSSILLSPHNSGCKRRADVVLVVSLVTLVSTFLQATLLVSL